MSETTENVPGFYGKGDPVMEMFFAQFVRFAWGDQRFRRQFEADTGTPALAKGGINAAIDKATGLPQEYAARFIPWLIENHWGPEGAGEPQ